MAVNLIGVSGASYLYEPNQIPVGSWNALAGGYIFAYANPKGLWVILYVGETQSYADRLPKHERWAEAVRLGATHILTRVNSLGEGSRQYEEKDLIGAYNPPMNTQHRPQLQTPGQVGVFGRKN